MINCLDHGFIQLIDSMPRENLDGEICKSARLSYNNLEKQTTLSEDRNLIRYLFRNKHTSPFEMVEFKFLCKMPIFVARQWARHRTANINEQSARYSELESDFYVPENFRKQSTTNKQGGEEFFSKEVNENLQKQLSLNCNDAYEIYKSNLKVGVSKELARIILPVNFYTKWVWKIDLHNLLHFLTLRSDSHAQYEIRVYANAILAIIEKLVPLTFEAWEDYRKEAMTLSKLEIDAIAKAEGFKGSSRESTEFDLKIERLRL
jgi:thymidylate synthase (FAD)